MIAMSLPSLRRSLAALCLGLAAACTSGPGPVDDASYLTDVAESRRQKDQMLKTEQNSPLTPEARATFTGLPYYPIKPDFRVPAVLTENRSGPPVIIEMQTTDGNSDKMRKVGSLGFSLGATRYTLTAFADVNDRTMDRLFVPFGDLTNGSDTYKGGRYLNLRRTATNIYDLDFNQAFHPYCVYNPTWVCPVPPRENRLQVAIEAGERLSKSGQ